MSDTPNTMTPMDTALNDNPSPSNITAATRKDAASYFDALYSGNSDPWQYQTRWYEKRKRDMCLAVLPQATYKNAIELGCGNGVFSELLAQRCHALLSIDGNNKAVQLASQRLADTPNVRVIQGVIPKVLDTLADVIQRAGVVADAALLDAFATDQQPFDLIVISEILYYLSPDDIDKVIAWIEQNLASGGTLLCCHWRYPIEGFEMTGESVHQRLVEAFNGPNRTDSSSNHLNQAAFTQQSKTVDSDFLLDIWQNSAKSVAMQENLV